MSDLSSSLCSLDLSIGTVNEERKRFSWDRILLEGQERLAAFIDMERLNGEKDKPKAIKKLNDIQDEQKDGIVTSTSEEAISNNTDSSEAFELKGIHRFPLISDNKPTAGYNYMSFARASMDGTRSWNPTLPFTTLEGSAVTTCLDIEGALIENQSSKLYSDSPIDRMQKTIRRHSEQSRKRPMLLATNPTVATEKLSRKPEKEKGKVFKKSKGRPKKPPASSPDVIEAPTMIDKLVDKLVMSALPISAVNMTMTDWRAQKLKGQPPFSINTMGGNFRKLTARTGIIFETIYTVQEILSWKNPYFTISAFAIYSYLVLHPRLIPTVPLLIISYNIMVPAYIYRHPPNPNWMKSNNPIPAAGPPISDAIVPKPVPEISREFFYNVVDTQNIMVVFIVGYDLVLSFLGKFAYFENDERTSSFVFISLLFSVCNVYFVTPFIIRYTPWRFVFFMSGWVIAALSHPRCRERLVDPLILELKKKKDIGKKTFNHVVSSTREKVVGKKQEFGETSEIEDILQHYDDSNGEDSIDEDSSSDSEITEIEDSLISKYEAAWERIESMAQYEFNYYEPHEQREVEIFEVQYTFKSLQQSQAPKSIVETDNTELSPPLQPLINKDGTGHWNPSTFTTHPFLPIIRGSANPWDTSFSNNTPSDTDSETNINMIQAPPAWQYISGAAWKLDLNPDTWVASRGVPMAAQTGETFVTIDQNEKWVYDKYPATPHSHQRHYSDQLDSTTVPTAEIGSVAKLSEGISAMGGIDDKPKRYIRRRRWTRICTRIASPMDGATKR